MALKMIVIVLFLPCFLSSAFGADSVDVVNQPPTATVNEFYIGNRAPLLPLPLIQLPVGTIKPEGWLRKQLELQRDGFSGHLGEISGFLEKEQNAWLDPKGEGTHGWEEPPYWLKGYLNLVHILGDEEGIAESRVWIEAALASRQKDGWFGPDKGRKGAATRLEGREDLWPNMIMLFCLQDHYSATLDRRVIDLMSGYFQYLETVPEDRFLVGYWPRMRGGDLLFSVYWLYNQTGEEHLLELAKKVYRKTADWTSGLIDWHNVNISQAFGQPTTYYMQSRDPIHLEASYRNFDAIREQYGQVPGGMFGGDENCRRGHTGPRQAVETCGMVEMMLSAEQLVSITGDPLWADRCEDVAFNSLPAALTPDLKALRYLTAPNMVLSDRQSKSPELQNGGPMLHMNPHEHRCCQHNWGHGWPYYAEHLFYATPDQGVAAVLYSDCRLEVRVGDGTRVSIDENTHYPFDGRVELVVETPRPVGFPLYLRIPSWCADPLLEIDGKPAAVRADPGQYIRIQREWRGRQVVVLTLPMEISIREWTGNHGSVSVDRGPLTYSLKIGEQYVREGGTDEWPAW
ncbi:MAG: beta-L-arabinofuranosidase domain-containing protein, partial [Planctomycetota bacterium]